MRVGYNFQFRKGILLVGGEIQETSKKNVLKVIAAQDLLQEVSYEDVPLESVLICLNNLS